MTPLMTNCKFKDAMYEQFARISKALSSPKRLELVDLLCQTEHSVEDLAGAAGLSVANTSRHLLILKSAGLVESEKRGLFVVYRVAGRQVHDFVQAIRALAADRLAEVERIVRDFMEAHPGLEPVDREVLRERMRSGSVTLLDVRPRDEYRSGHIPGAICIPLEELEEHLGRLPKDREIVAYCRGPYCVLAVEAVETLRAGGFRAFRLEDGVRDWQAHGFEIAVGG